MTVRSQGVGTGTPGQIVSDGTATIWLGQGTGPTLSGIGKPRRLSPHFLIDDDYKPVISGGYHSVV